MDVLSPSPDPLSSLLEPLPTFLVSCRLCDPCTYQPLSSFIFALLYPCSNSSISVLARDFAFVAGDKDSCMLKCHVFRCDVPAKAIASALHGLCAQVRAMNGAGDMGRELGLKIPGCSGLV